MSSRARATAMAWMGLLLVLLNALLPAVVPATPAWAAPSLSVAASAALSGEQIVICTPSGLRIITVDAQGQPIEQQDSTREGYCVFCVPMVHAASGALAPDGVALVAPSLVPLAVLPFAPLRQQGAPSVEQTYAQSRAPPVA